MPIYKKIDKNFFKKWSHKMAYVLGFFFADGSLDVNLRGAHYFSFQICDGVLLEHIRSAMCSEHKITKRIHFGNEQDQYRMQMGSIEMCNDLRRLGVSEQKSKTMYIPNIPAKYAGDFIRGYFDGDGNVWVGTMHKDRDKQSTGMLTAFTSCSQNFLVGLQSLLKKKGLKGGSLFKIKNVYKLQYSINDSIMLSQIMYSCRGFNGLCLERKKRIFEKFKKMRL